VTDPCSYLEYRTEGDGQSFDTERAYCTAVDEFVQPMRADICSRRFGLEPGTDCEHYRDAEGLPAVPGLAAESEGERGGGGPE
jgi:hypothetical protein